MLRKIHDFRSSLAACSADIPDEIGNTLSTPLKKSGELATIDFRSQRQLRTRRNLVLFFAKTTGTPTLQARLIEVYAINWILLAHLGRDFDDHVCIRRVQTHTLGSNLSRFAIIGPPSRPIGMLLIHVWPAKKAVYVSKHFKIPRLCFSQNLTKEITVTQLVMWLHDPTREIAFSVEVADCKHHKGVESAFGKVLHRANCIKGSW